MRVKKLSLLCIYQNLFYIIKYLLRLLEVWWMYFMITILHKFSFTNTNGPYQNPYTIID